VPISIPFVLTQELPDVGCGTGTFFDLPRCSINVQIYTRIILEFWKYNVVPRLFQHSSRFLLGHVSFQPVHPPFCTGVGLGKEVVVDITITDGNL